MSLRVFVLGKRYTRTMPVADSPIALVEAVISIFSLSVQPDDVILRKISGEITLETAQALYDTAGENNAIIDGRSLPVAGDSIVAKIEAAPGAFSHYLAAIFCS